LNNSEIKNKNQNQNQNSPVFKTNTDQTFF